MKKFLPTLEDSRVGAINGFLFSQSRQLKKWRSMLFDFFIDLEQLCGSYDHVKQSSGCTLKGKMRAQDTRKVSPKTFH